MNYSATDFLFLFPAFCLLHWLLPAGRPRLVGLLIASFLFYAYGDPRGVPILIAVTLLAFLVGRSIGSDSGRRSSLIAASAVGALVTLLMAFKFTAVGASPLQVGPGAGATLPLGISFFTFEAISYIVDVRRGATVPERSLLRFSLFIGLFPHLVSGPIMRANQLLPQLRELGGWRSGAFLSGLELFVWGLVQKRLIGDPAGAVVDRILAGPTPVGTSAAWVAALGYAVQAYGDFSGYTDMGRGIARMLGFELSLNFNAPYASRSIGEFWSRWHMTLASWLRDYVWMPLFALRRGPLRRATAFQAYAVTVTLTMLIAGIWHGVTWTFLVWGAYQGALLSIERRWPWQQRIPPWAAWLGTLVLIINGMVMVRAESLGTLGAFLTAMYVPSVGALPPGLRDTSLVAGLFAAVVGADLVRRHRPAIVRSALSAGWVRGLVVGTALGLVLTVAPTDIRPFIYFRF